MTYGLAADSDLLQPVSGDNTAAICVPSDETLAATWLDADFEVDARWLTGGAVRNNFGFDQQGVLPPTIIGIPRRMATDSR